MIGVGLNFFYSCYFFGANDAPTAVKVCKINSFSFLDDATRGCLDVRNAANTLSNLIGMQFSERSFG